MPARTPSLAWAWLVGIVVVCAAWYALSGPANWQTTPEEEVPILRLYCAHDAHLAQSVLDQFEFETGIVLEIVYDTEATKSLGLVERIKREREAPRCDVFWNNQVLGTMELADEGLLEPYQSLSADRIPNKYKDLDGLWTGFAGRLRVWIAHNGFIVSQSSFDQAEMSSLAQGDPSRMAIAKPMFGTTLSHCCLLWEQMGESEFKKWFNEMRARDIKVVAGNAAVKDLVAEGICDIGWTDTDDFYSAKAAGAPVTLAPIRLPSGETICIPNSVAIIKGTSQLKAAQQLVDFLVSPKTQLQLARDPSIRQIPLGPLRNDQVDAEVWKLRKWADESIDIKTAFPARNPCLQWLKSQFVPIREQARRASGVGLLMMCQRTSLTGERFLMGLTPHARLRTCLKNRRPIRFTLHLGGSMLKSEFSRFNEGRAFTSDGPPLADARPSQREGERFSKYVLALRDVRLEGVAP